jgi:hypothetical protein
MQIIGYVKKSDIPKLQDPVEKYKVSISFNKVIWNYVRTENTDIQISVDINEFDAESRRLVKTLGNSIS